MKFHDMRLAIISAKAALAIGKDIKLEEETLIRFNKFGDVNDEKFRIDMTERVKRMLRVESQLSTSCLRVDYIHELQHNLKDSKIKKEIIL